jgi:putative ABC transport system substrate-binding protein
MIKRREFITLLGGAAAAWPVAARAQQPTIPVIGYLDGATLEGSAHLVAAFRRGLAETGYVEGRNVAIEHRWADGQIDPLPAMAADLVRRRVALIIAAPSPAALAAKSATTTIPIVFVSGVDPVQAGLVLSLNRPGGNLTGVSQFTHTLDGKRLEILRELAPMPGVIGVLVNDASSAAASWVPDFLVTARTVQQEVRILSANNENEIDTAFATIRDHPLRALLVGGGALYRSRRKQIVDLAARYSIPAMYDRREYVAAGGLISYDTSSVDVYHQIGLYAGRILKGEKPADLPVVQPTKFDLVLNLRTAGTLGLSPSATLLALADEVIE